MHTSMGLGMLARLIIFVRLDRDGILNIGLAVIASFFFYLFFSVGDDLIDLASIPVPIDYIV